MVDSSGQLKRPLKIRRFQKSRLIVVALNEESVVVGVSTIRKGTGVVAKMANLTVDERYRRQGIATRLTEIRIAEARNQQIELLFARIKKTNVASIGNLQKAGFKLWGSFVKPPGTGSAVSWFYLPLSPQVDWSSVLQPLTDGRVRVD